MSRDSDVVVIGSGINSLVAAAELALAGRSVTLIERNRTLGGFIDSGPRTVTGFVHDTYSSWHPLFVSSAAYGALGEELSARGLRYRNTDEALTAGVNSHGCAAIAYRDPERTVAGFDQTSDADAYRTMLTELHVHGPAVFGALGTELDRRGLAALAVSTIRSQRSATEDLVREALSSGRSFLQSRFSGSETDRLWSPWLLHAGLTPDSATGGVMLPVMAGTMHQFGLPVVEGGARNFVNAFHRILADHGTQMVLGDAATEIVIADGRAVAVRTANEEYRAGLGVVASVTPQALYTQLLAPGTVDERTRAAARSYRFGRGAMQIHLALDTPVPWDDARLGAVPLIHLTAGAASIAVACAEASAGLLPRRPTVVIGQQCVLDPSRAPAGKATLWIQLQEVPYTPVGDAAAQIDTSDGWTEQVRTAYADRVIAQIAELATGFERTILGRDIIAPTDLEAHNHNAVGGDPYCGSAEIDQNLRWRPITSHGRHRTDIDGLWHIGAATHPGPGLGGGSGHLVARQIISGGSRRRLRRLLP
ncbi:NAD(P)/FAD-dependent oxidoreductase [Gordonia jinhuaensis]|uniref:Pyridine nucleotide-disulfide oxidoreductase domain-containing protein 2 n=1 Tax=Gordonia jinhuaensis TaxID=1517702 RepID=A0A916SWV4_9ACTN|nr:NAD(P)/FAD-dependent oxidoreductase [Gordonia jinhuaensis]GGB20575.1 FAD-dependent oxidoreductase [Gordonia jinhuaensis]